MHDYLFEWIGRLFALFIGWKLLFFFCQLIRVYVFPTYPDFGKYGKWSVITGATDGIGKALAFELAAHGQNIVLIARNKEKLEKVSEAITFQHGVLVKHLQIDFRDDECIYEKIEAFLKGYDIGVLVNNVGIAQPLATFTEIPNLSSLITEITKVNMLSVMKMSQIVLPGMRKRRRGCVMNISSAAGVFPAMNGAVYGATKAFMKHLSLAISYEYEDDGITIQCCTPFFINTNLSKKMMIWKKMLSAEGFASSLLGTLEKERETCGNAGFTIKSTFYNFLPGFIMKAGSNFFIARMKRSLEEKKIKD